MAITLGDAQAVLSWSKSDKDYVLQSTRSLRAPDWKAVLQAPATNGIQLSVTVPLSSQEDYFRLRSE